MSAFRGFAISSIYLKRLGVISGIRFVNRDLISSVAYQENWSPYSQFVRRFGSMEGPVDVPAKEELQKKLTRLQFHVTQEKGTERPFTGEYDKKFDEGSYSCIVCEQYLFSSNTKYDSGCGWPAFNDVLEKGRIKLLPDTSGGRIRTEVQCSKCNAHLGHVFDDGPKPTGKRYCINSASIRFHPAEGK